MHAATAAPLMCLGGGVTFLQLGMAIPRNPCEDLGSPALGVKSCRYNSGSRGFKAGLRDSDSWKALGLRLLLHDL